MGYHPKCGRCGEITDIKDGISYCVGCKVYYC